MENIQAAKIFESLSSPIRLQVFRLLVQAGLDGMVAGDIASQLSLPPTNLSFHLKALALAGLVSVEQQGRFIRYRANLSLMFELIGYLSDQCCAGQPQLCLPQGPGAGTPDCCGD